MVTKYSMWARITGANQLICYLTNIYLVFGPAVELLFIRVGPGKRFAKVLTTEMNLNTFQMWSPGMSSE